MSKKGRHLCPSCGFEHDSEGNELAPVIVQQPAIATAGSIALAHAVTAAVGGAAVAAAAVLKPAASACPVCSSLGVQFVTELADEFNQHMAAGVHGSAAPAPAIYDTKTYTQPLDVKVEGESLSDEIARILGIQ